MLDWPLLSRHVLLLLRVGGSAAAVWLLMRILRVARSPRARTVTCTACLLPAVVVPLAGVHHVRDVWLIFPDRLPTTTYLWIGVDVLAGAMSLALLMMRCSARDAVIAVAACLNEVNVVFAAYPTPRDVVGIARPNVIALPDRHQKSLPPSDFGPSETTWTPLAGLARHGNIASADIPSTVSEFEPYPPNHRGWRDVQALTGS